MTPKINESPAQRSVSYFSFLSLDFLALGVLGGLIQDISMFKQCFRTTCGGPAPISYSKGFLTKAPTVTPAFAGKSEKVRVANSSQNEPQLISTCP